MNKGRFHGLVSAFFFFFSFWCFLLAISLFKMAHKCGAEVFLSCPGFLRTRKLRDAFQRKICVRQVLLKYELLCYKLWKWKRSRSVISDSLWPPGLQPTRVFSPWDVPGKNTGVGCHFLLQGIFPIQGSNPGLPYCRSPSLLYHLSHQRST